MAEITCKLCNRPVATKVTGAYRQLMGWVKKRDMGGTNSISLASEPMAWAHGSCMEELKMKSRGEWAEETSLMGNCEFCGSPVHDEAGTSRKVIGWAQIRKQGGSNSISLSSEALGWAHGDCVEQQKKRGGISWDQEGLF